MFLNGPFFRGKFLILSMRLAFVMFQILMLCEDEMKRKSPESLPKSDKGNKKPFR